MAFKIVQCRMTGKAIAARDVVGVEPTTPAAEAHAREAAARYPESGFDKDFGFWWGRDAAGTEFRFYIEVAEGSDEEDE
jgi:hypothetical protein